MRLRKQLSVWVVFTVVAGLAVLSSPTISMAVGNLYSLRSEHSDLMKSHKADRSDIQSLLERKIKDGELLQKVKAKLSVLGDEEISLITSLCERIEIEGTSARAEVAFLLITTLIILS